MRAKMSYRFKNGDRLVSSRRNNQIGMVIANNHLPGEPQNVPSSRGEWYLLKDINYAIEYYEHVDFLKLVCEPNDIMKDLV